jgi:ketosteroid isomerase-like protein
MKTGMIVLGMAVLWLVASLVVVGLAPAQGGPGEDAARRELDALYKGDYRAAFIEKKPELFLKHIADDFRSTSVEGRRFDAKALRELFPRQFTSMARTIEHNVTIEDVDVLPNGDIAAVVTLYTLIEFRKVQGSGTYFVTSVGTYRDVFTKRDGVLYAVFGDQLRNQTIAASRP